MIYSGMLTFTATAIDPIHHGAGSEGNTQLLRTQDIILDDGTPARVPFVSGNSIKHQIRDGGVRFALEAMTLPNGSMSKAVIDLLFSGGSLTKSGSAVNLEQARKIAELFPVLSLCGYSAGNFMQDSKIRVGHLHLVCKENSWRLPDNLRDDRHILQRAASFRGEEFGTRHEASRSQIVFKLLTTEDKEAKLKGNAESNQMIYDFEVVRPGSKWFGDIIFDDLTEFELMALRSAMERACIDHHGDTWIYNVGAKAAVGFGRMAFVFNGGLRDTLSAPQYLDRTGIAPNDDDANKDAMAAYIEHLRNRRVEILDALNAVVQ